MPIQEQGPKRERKFEVDEGKLTESDKKQLEIYKTQYPTFDPKIIGDQLFLTPEEHGLKSSTVPFTGGYPNTPRALLIFPDKLKEINEERKKIGVVQMYATYLKKFFDFKEEISEPLDVIGVNLAPCDSGGICGLPFYESNVPLNRESYFNFHVKWLKSTIESIEQKINYLKENPNDPLYLNNGITKETLLMQLEDANKNLELFILNYRPGTIL